jgi:1-acyl-sn-glycerol-3-phosphate acyltransferase
LKGNTRGSISAVIRSVLFLLWSASVIMLWLARRVFLTRARSAVVAAHYSSLWSRVTLRILGLEVAARGEPPAAPFFLVTNHLGYLDIAVIASVVPCTFVSKAEVARWPLFGTLASLSGTLYVDRGSLRDPARVNARIRSHFAAGGSLALFPEGTSTDGSAVAPFRSPLLEYPASDGMEVRCAAIRYFAPEGCPPASESMCWWGDMTLAPHLFKLFRMKGMRAEISFSPAKVRAGNRKDLAVSLRDEVRQSLGVRQAVV